MATNDLAGLQTRLNKDQELKAKFVKDPVATLRAEGVKVDAEQAKQLKSLVSSASKRPPAELARIRIIIRIGIEF